MISNISSILLASGAIFILIGGIGLIKLPDFFSRAHAGSIIESLGAIQILIGLMLISGFTNISLKLFLILVFLLITGPTAVHAMVNAARESQQKLFK